MMDLVLLIGSPLVLVAAYLVWKFWFGHDASSPLETPTRRREDARDWQRRFGADSPFAANFLQPTQNEILETLYVLDHLTPDWEQGDPIQVERNFLNELALNFPTLRKAACTFPLPFAESLTMAGKAPSPGARTSSTREAEEKEVARKREAFQQARAQMNALEQIVAARPPAGPVELAPGSLPFRISAADPGNRQKINLWPTRLAGAAVLLVAVFVIARFLPELVGSKPERTSSVPTSTSPSPTPAKAAPEASPKVAAVAETDAGTVSIPTPAPTAAATPGAIPPAQPPALSTMDKIALAQQIAASQQRAVSKYPALAVEGSEINLRFVYRYKNLQQENSPRLLDPAWPEKLAEECAAASVTALKHSSFTEVRGAPR